MRTKEGYLNLDDEVTRLTTENAYLRSALGWEDGPIEMADVFLTIRDLEFKIQEMALQAITDFGQLQEALEDRDLWRMKYESII
jgi:hypothetical protein